MRQIILIAKYDNIIIQCIYTSIAQLQVGYEAFGAASNYSDLETKVKDLSLDSKGNNDNTKRAVAVNSEKLKIVQEALGFLDGKLEASAGKCKERENVLKDLSKLYESQEKAILALQNTVAMQGVEIAQLTMKLEGIAKLSDDGILNWEIKDYRKRKLETATTGPTSFYSEAFFTSRTGYKMCGRVYLNGDGVGKGKYLSIFFAIKRGDHDSFLQWPFRRRVCFRLLNQSGKPHIEDAFRPDPSSSSFSKPQREMNIASGCPLFALQEDVENPQKGFIKNDTILLQIEVNASDT